MKTLIVDDDQICRIVLQKILERMGLSDYEFAVDGQDAIEKVTQSFKIKETYDLIFLDVYMPHKDGISAIKEIRAIEREMGVKQYNSVKIIMVSSSTDDLILVNAYESNCDGYLTKPYNYSTISCQLEALGFSVCSD